MFSKWDLKLGQILFSFSGTFKEYQDVPKWKLHSSWTKVSSHLLSYLDQLVNRAQLMLQFSCYQFREKWAWNLGGMSVQLGPTKRWVCRRRLKLADNDVSFCFLRSGFRAIAWAYRCMGYWNIHRTAECKTLNLLCSTTEKCLQVHLSITRQSCTVFAPYDKVSEVIVLVFQACLKLQVCPYSALLLGWKSLRQSVATSPRRSWPLYCDDY